MKSILPLAIVVLVASHVHAGGRSDQPNLMDVFMASQIKQSTSLSVAVPEKQSQFATASSFALTAPAASTLCSTGLQNNGQSVVFHDHGKLQTDLGSGATVTFSFRSVLEQILASNPDPLPNPDPAFQTPTTPEAFFASLLATYNSTMLQKEGPGMLVDQRIEAGLDAATMIQTMEPTALFNRFDLASPTGADCGEYRMVFNQPAPPQGAINPRFFIIFEARYPNPAPGMGVAGCQAVADFWALLDTLDADTALGWLKTFYFQGVPRDADIDADGKPDMGGVWLPPVFHYNRFVEGAGQVRVNSFVAGFPIPWQLREFHVDTDFAGNATVFAPTTVKSNPLAELYSGGPLLVSGKTSLVNGSTENQAFIDDFRTDFLQNYFHQLMAAEEEARAEGGSVNTIPEDILIHSTSLSNDDRFNEFQSDSDAVDDINAFIGIPPAAPLISGIVSAIEGNILNDPGTAPTVAIGDTDWKVDYVLNRASAMTCNGCHQNANDLPIGPPDTPGGPEKKWPSSLQFVHVDESSALSDALKLSFLPKRKAMLEQFVCSPPKPDFAKWFIPMIDLI